MPEINIKRAYDAPSPSDGYRILVDRLWPRGLTHERLDCQMWAKDIAPSAQLRQWFHADIPGRWQQFQQRYKEELQHSEAFHSFLDILRQHPVVILVYASRDHLHNEAAVLQNLCRTQATR